MITIETTETTPKKVPVFKANLNDRSSQQPPLNFNNQPKSKVLRAVLRANDQLYNHLQDNSIPPHNSRTHWVIKKPVIKELLDKAKAHRVLGLNQFRFAVLDDDIEVMLKKFPLLMASGNSSYRIYF